MSELSATLGKIIAVPDSKPASALPPQTSLWYKVTKHPLVMPYNRLAVLVTALNAAVYLANPALTREFVFAMVMACFAAAILIRQQYVINLLFAIATSLPLTAPLKLRWAAGKVYHFGGIHVGAFFSGTLWYALLSRMLAADTTVPASIRALCALHLVILTAMIVMALPSLRAKYHNQFELTARFGGWASLLIFWIQTAVLSPVHLWVPAVLTLSVALPWLRLKKVPVEILRPSPHAVLAKFDYGVTPFAGSSTDLSRNPLLEWHSFANVPWPDREGFRLTISRAGDWTAGLIDNPPSHIWVKGIPTAGVGNIEKLFKKVVWVATGSGIGPCLPHLLAGKVPSTLVWSTKNPRRTYGDAMVDEILAVQKDALIWDTDKSGKPDLAALAYRAYVESGAEAVICIANKKTTWHIVYEMESRGIPAFGAIWDS